MSEVVALDALPELVNPVITIGSFDGIHRGHQKILAQVRESAKKVEGHSVLISFEPHPRKVLFSDRPISLLTSAKQKRQLLQKLGLDFIVMAPFTQAFSQLSAEDYIQDFLVKHFHPKQIIIGYDHRFGHDRCGDIHLLKSYASQYGYQVIEIPAELIQEAAISSTQIRHAIQSGDLQRAEDMLGRPYSVLGKVVKGAQKGRTLGYPTANLSLDDPQQLLPPVGVYAAQVKRAGDQNYGAMVNLGFRPTLYAQGERHLEAHLLDFSQDLYGEELELVFLCGIRDEIQFSGLDQLQAQLAKDEKEVRSLLDRRNIS